MTATAMLSYDAGLMNALIAQKEHLIQLIDKSEDDKDLRLAFDMLKLLAPVWIATGYSYKAKELAKRIIATANILRLNANTMAEEIPARCHAQRRSWQYLATRLEQFRDAVTAFLYA